MDPLDQLPFYAQAVIAAATFALIFLIGRYLWLAVATARGLLTFAYVRGKIEDSNDSRRSIVIPSAYADTERALRDLGFILLGALRRHYPRDGSSAVYQVLRTQDSTTMATFRRAEPHNLRISFLTWFEDDSLIVTSYPYGYALENDRIVYRFARTSLSAAHAYHQRRVAGWTARGRVPVAIEDMDSYLRREAYFRQHYLPLLDRGSATDFVLVLVPTVLAAVGAIAAVIAIYRAQPALAVVFLAGMALAMWARGRLLARFYRLTYNAAGAVDDPAAAADA